MRTISIRFTRSVRLLSVSRMVMKENVKRGIETLHHYIADSVRLMGMHKKKETDAFKRVRLRHCSSE